MLLPRTVLSVSFESLLLQKLKVDLLQVKILLRVILKNKDLGYDWIAVYLSLWDAFVVKLELIVLNTGFSKYDKWLALFYLVLARKSSVLLAIKRKKKK